MKALGSIQRLTWLHKKALPAGSVPLYFQSQASEGGLCALFFTAYLLKYAFHGRLTIFLILISVPFDMLPRSYTW